MQTAAPKLQPPLSPHSDQELIEIALAGDQRGYEALMRRYQDRLHRSMCVQLGCSAMAEDVVQDAFVQAFCHLSSFGGRSRFYSWLYRIALNCRRKYLRSSRNLEALPSPSGSGGSGEDFEPSPLESLERQERREHVRQALAALHHQHRTVLTLREYDGLDYQSIADILGVETGTVRSRISRARANLRWLLTRQSAAVFAEEAGGE